MKDAINRFKQYVAQRYPERSTSKHYMSDLAIFHQHIGDVQPQTITPRMISHFVETQSTQGLKGATINRRLSALSSFFEFLIFETEADDWSNPVQWKRHSIRPGHHLPSDVSDQTVSQLLAVIEDKRDRALFGLMINAGLRVGEVVDLQLNDLHPLEQNGLAQFLFDGRPYLWLMQFFQTNGQPIITEIQLGHLLPTQTTQGEHMLRHPIFHRFHTVVLLTEDMHQPHRDHPPRC